MKKILPIALLLNGILLFSQTKEKSSEVLSENYNQWTIELATGQFKGIKPFAEGYSSSSPNNFLGKIELNSFSVSSRYMISPKFGFKLGLHYDELKNSNNLSLPFKIQQNGVSLEGVINANRVLNIDHQLGRFGILLHGGIRVNQLISKTPNVRDNQNFNKKDLNLGLVFGVTPQIRVTNKIAFFGDITYDNTQRQHLNWDGSNSDLSANNLNAQSFTTSLGLTYSFGANKIHGDWAKIKDENLKKLAKIKTRIDDVSKLLVDTDKDGVADFLDQENNSAAGAAVDTRGKMVDLNRNGVPDEMERYLANNTKKVIGKTNQMLVENMINSGKVLTNFKNNSSIPSGVSTEGIGFIRTYLNNYPEAKLEIIGHADSSENTEKNTKLAQDRANAVKDILIKAGIDTNRLIISDTVSKDAISDLINLSSVTYKVLD